MLAAVAVRVAGDLTVLLGVRGIGHPRRSSRAGDVGDRRDVVPVDAVPDAEQESREQDADIDGGRGDGGGSADEVEHVAGPSRAGLEMRSRDNSISQRVAIESRGRLVYAFAR